MFKGHSNQYIGKKRIHLKWNSLHSKNFFYHTRFFRTVLGIVVALVLAPKHLGRFLLQIFEVPMYTRPTLASSIPTRRYSIVHLCIAETKIIWKSVTTKKMWRRQSSIRRPPEIQNFVAGSCIVYLANMLRMLWTDIVRHVRCDGPTTSIVAQSSSHERAQTNELRYRWGRNPAFNS